MPEDVAFSSTAWLAGLLEGEGCFTQTIFTKHKIGYCYPLIKVGMCDQDVVERVAKIFQSPVHCQNRGRFKLVWTTSLNGFKSLPVMLRVFPLMGERRRRRIDMLLSEWEHDHTHKRRGNQWTRKVA